MNDIEFLQESVTKELVEILMIERDLNLADALSLLEETDAFTKLMDEETGLYRESASYVYEILDGELAHRA